MLKLLFMIYGMAFVFTGGLMITLAPPEKQLYVIFATIMGAFMLVSTLFLKAPWEKK